MYKIIFVSGYELSIDEDTYEEIVLKIGKGTKFIQTIDGLIVVDNIQLIIKS